MPAFSRFPLAAALTFVLSAAAALAPAAGLAQDAATSPTAAPPSAQLPPPQVPQIIALTEADVQKFLAVTRAFFDQGVGLRPGPDGQPAAQALAILEANGLTAVDAQQIGFSVSMAFSVLQRGPEALLSDLQRSREQLKGMRSSMPAEQQAVIDQQLAVAALMLERLETQPAANVEIVGRYEDEVSTLLGKLRSAAPAGQN